MTHRVYVLLFTTPEGTTVDSVWRSRKDAVESATKLATKWKMKPRYREWSNEIFKLVIEEFLLLPIQSEGRKIG